MSDQVLQGHISMSSEREHQIVEKAIKDADALSQTVHDIMDARRQGKVIVGKPINAKLDKLDDDTEKKRFNDEEKKTYKLAFKAEIEFKHTPIVPELELEDFRDIDVNPTNFVIQKCELDAYTDKKRINAGIDRDAILDELQYQAPKIAPGEDLCKCQEPVTAPKDIPKFEKNVLTGILHNSYFQKLVGSDGQKVFDELSGGAGVLDQARIERDLKRSIETFNSYVDELGNNSGLLEMTKLAYRVAAQDLDDRASVDAFLLENWKEIQGSSSGITLGAIKNYAKTLQ